MDTKKKIKKYKAFNITQEELNAIRAAEEQLRSCSESSSEEYAEWVFEQITLIRSFILKLKIQ